MTRKEILVLIILGLSLLLLAASPPPETPTPAVIRLQYATFDPLLDGVPAVPANLSAPRTAPDAPGLYIVQFEDTIPPDGKTALTNLGVVVESYLPENAFPVRLTPAAVETAPTPTPTNTPLPTPTPTLIPPTPTPTNTPLPTPTAGNIIFNHHLYLPLVLKRTDGANILIHFRQYP